MAFLVDDLFVADGGECLRIPVHHTNATINKSFVVEVNEDIDDTLVTDVIHREGGTVPVARCTEFTQLLQDDAAILLLPLPSMLQELVTCQRTLVNTLLCEHLHHLGFGGDAGVVGTRHPAGVLALHAGAAHQHILNGVVEHVTHMKYSRNIGRRNDYSVRMTTVRFRMKQFLLQPKSIPFFLYGMRIIFRCNFHYI